MQERITRTQFIEEVNEMIADKTYKELKPFIDGIKKTQDEKGIKLLDEILENVLRNRKAEKIRAITKHMCSAIEFYLDVNALWRYKDDYDESFKLLDIFNYGYMMGVRAERARRAKRKAIN